MLKELPGKTIILWVLNLGDENIESPEAIAARIRQALAYVSPDRLQVAPDCGMKYLSRPVALAKLQALTRAAAMVRESLD